MITIKFDKTGTVKKASQTVRNSCNLDISFLDDINRIIPDDTSLDNAFPRKPFNYEILIFEFNTIADLKKRFHDTFGIRTAFKDAGGTEAVDSAKLESFLIEQAAGPGIKEDKAAPATTSPKSIVKDLEQKEIKAFLLKDYISLAEEILEKTSDRKWAEKIYSKAFDKVIVFKEYLALIDSVERLFDDTSLALVIAEKALAKAVFSSDKEALEERISGLKAAADKIAEQENPTTEIVKEVAITEPVVEMLDEEKPVEAPDVEDAPDSADVIADVVLDDEILLEAGVSEAGLIDAGEKEPELPESVIVEEKESITFQTIDIDEVVDEKMIEVEIEEALDEEPFEDQASIIEDNDYIIAEESVPDEPEEAQEEDVLSLSFEELRHKAVALVEFDSDIVNAKKVFSSAEDIAVTSDEYRRLARSVQFSVNDEEWSKNLCYLSEVSAKNYNDFKKLAETVFELYLNKSWATALCRDAFSNAKDKSQLTELSSFVGTYLNDRTFAEMIEKRIN